MWKAHEGLLKKKSQFRKRVIYVRRDADWQLNRKLSKEVS